jgi:hypothetical protein
MTMTDSDRIPDAAVLPVLRTGRTMPAGAAVRTWATVGWLLSVEGRAYIEDVEGGVRQPEMRRLVLLRLLELLAEVDARLGGRHDIVGEHQLALAWEYGLHEVLDADGTAISDLFGLDDPLGSPDEAVTRVVTLWEQLCAAFPGELPDPLVPEGQGQILRALRSWSKLAAATHIDASFLEPFLKDA